MQALLLALACAFAPLSEPAGLEPAGPREDYEEVLARFQRAAGSAGKEREAALEALVATGVADAAESLIGEYVRAAPRLRMDRSEARHTRYALERRGALLAGRTARGETSGEPSADELALGELRGDLARVERRIGESEPWCAALAAGLTNLLAAIGPHKARRVIGALATDAEEHPEFDVQLASLELLGGVGPDGTALAIHGLMEDWTDERARFAKKLPKLVGEVREMERRVQQDHERTDGGIAKDTDLLYRKALAAANAVRLEGVRRGLLVEAGAEAGGAALMHESEEELEKSLAALARFLQKEKGRMRLDTLALLAHARSERVVSALRALLDDEHDPLVTAEIIDALATLSDREVAPLLIEGFAAHEHAHVRSRAFAALAVLRSRDAIPMLIDRLDVEEGRLRSDAGAALASLAERDFHGNALLWRRWWEEHGEDFEPAPAPVRPSAVEAAAGAAGVTFFGIRTESQRVLFVLDVSGSMNYTTAPRPGVPESNPRDQRLYPRDDEISRLVAARRDLIKALGGLRDGGRFNIVLYASDVWSWQDELVGMDPDARAEALEFIEAIVALGGTNIYGALDRALDVAGAGASQAGRWSEPGVDTIYLLTDGQASVGLTIDAEEILAMVRERNRTAGIVIHTIGLSAGHDAVLLRRLAEENGGTYVGR